MTVRAILLGSPEPTASAIWRTPLLLMPISAILRVRSAIDPYTPSKPTPAGPSNTAIALIRIIPIATFSTDDPPINADDLRICPYVCFSMTALSTALAARSGGPADSLFATLSGFPPAFYATSAHPPHHALEVSFV